MPASCEGTTCSIHSPWDELLAQATAACSCFQAVGGVDWLTYSNTSNKRYHCSTCGCCNSTWENEQATACCLGLPMQVAAVQPCAWSAWRR